MAKTRRQTRSITVKKEEEGCKSTLGLGNVTRTTRTTIAKRRPSKNKSRTLPAQQVKVEEDNNTKPLLQLSLNNSNLPNGQQVSQEQINQLIHAIVDDNMSITKAARKAKISIGTGSRYYNAYKNDPEKKIPSPRTRWVNPSRIYTQQDIENLIAYIEDDKMSVSKASSKASMTYVAGRYYYAKYLQDPDHNIPVPHLGQRYTQDKREVFIGYIVNDKMSIRAASKKANLSNATGRKYCHEYFNDQNPGISPPSHIAPYTHYTPKQVREAVGYIIDDKMTTVEASRRVNMTHQTVTYHYLRYLKGHNMELPVPKVIRPCTQEDKNELIRLIFEENMSITAAAKKAPMYYSAAQKYYHQYVKDHNIDITPKYSQDQINQFIGYIVVDKMSKKAAAKKANMPIYTCNKYYNQYLIDHPDDQPAPKYTQDEKDEFISYIVDDKMSVMGAARKANMPQTTAARYYQKYLMAHNIDPPVPKTITQDQIDKLISYMLDDKMTMKAAAKKVNMSSATGTKYYRQYLKDHNLDIPTIATTQDKIVEVIGYIVDDKMNMMAASKKANICPATTKKYYRQYLEDHNLSVPIPKRFTQTEINDLISYIVHNKMSIKAAAKRVNMSDAVAVKYYRRYQKENNLPVPVPKIITQEQINALISYIVDDKMSINAASKKANMVCTTGSKYYQQYLNNQ